MRLTPLAFLCATTLLGEAPSGFPEIAKRAASAREANRTGDAIRLYRECARLRPAWTEGWWYLGTLLYEDNRFAEARDAFSRFVKLDAKAPPGWALLGLCEYETQNYAASLEHIQRGLALGLDANPPMSWVARYHAALLLTHFRQFEAALQIFVQLAAEGDRDSGTMAAAGIPALRMAQLPAEVPAGDRELVARVGRAIFDTGARRPIEAKRDFDELLATYPDTPEIHYLHGGFLLLSDPDAAIREWKRELELSPRHVPARLQLAYEYLKRGDAAAALPFAERAAELDPDSFVAHNALGRALVEANDLKRGIAELEAACALGPDSAENHVALASAYTKAGRKEDAARQRAEFLRLKKMREQPQNQP